MSSCAINVSVGLRSLKLAFSVCMFVGALRRSSGVHDCPHVDQASGQDTPQTHHRTGRAPMTDVLFVVRCHVDTPLLIVLVRL